MSGDSDNEFDSVGQTPAPPAAEPKADEPERAPRRAFRAWAPAQQEESALSKLGKRISGIFGKKKTGSDTGEQGEQTDASDLQLIMPEDAAENETPVVTAGEAPVTAVDEAAATPPQAEIDPAFYVPPELESQLRPEAEAEAEAEAEVVPEPEPEPEPEVEPALQAETPSELVADLVAQVESESGTETEPEAQPRKPGLFSRLFGRKPKEEAEPAIESFEVEKDESAELHAAAMDEEPLIATQESAVDGLDVPAETLEPMALDSAIEAIDEPPTIPMDEPAESPFAESPTAPMDAPPMFEEPPTEPMPERRGLFGRLFSRKPKVSRPVPVELQSESEQVPVGELQAEPEAAAWPEPEAEPEAAVWPEPEPEAEPEAAVWPEAEPEPEQEAVPELEAAVQPELQTSYSDSDSDASFSTVDEALPAEPQPSTVDLIEAALAEPILEEEKKPGFFSRLFGRKSKSEPRPSLEIEFHEDRIEAAAHALDDVSGESFAGAAADPADPYASVEDALPGEAEPEPEPEVAAEAEFDLTSGSGSASDSESDSTLEVPAIAPSDLRFAPPPVEEPAPADSRSTLEIEPFDPFAETLDPNDAAAVPPPDSRSTIEVEQREPRSTEELELEAELGLRPSDDTDRKTDEFEIASVDTEATTGEILETETTQAAKLTWWMRLLGRKPKTLEAGPGMPAGTVVEGNPNFLFSKFKAFYNEIIRFKHQKTEFAAGFSTAILTDFNADLSPDAAASAQSEQLKNMLDLQAAEAQWVGGEAKERYPEAQYAMACMADELFAYMEWDGQAAWRNHLLEVKLFKSHAADVELFKRIDKLLKESPNSHVARDLARVYLLVLAAGFQGKYRPFGLPRALAQYRQRLYEYIHQGDSLMLYAPDRKIFPDAASRTLEGHAVGRFSSLQRWAAILVFLVLGYTVLAHYAWNRVSADLKDVTERIRAASSTSGASTSPTSSNSTAATGAGGSR